MFHRSKLRALLLACAVSALAGLSSPARAVVYYQELNFSFSPILPFEGAGTTVFSDFKSKPFQQFSPSFGTLTAARWELTSAWGADGSVTVASQSTDPDTPVTGGFELQIGMDSRVNFAGGLQGTGGQYFSDEHKMGDACTATLASGPCGVYVAANRVFDGVIQVTDLSSLIGNGEFVQGVEFALAMTQTLDAAGSISSVGRFVWDDLDERALYGKLRLVLEVDPLEPANNVPEPSSLPLAVVALAASAMFRTPLRRRTSHPR